MRYIVLRSMHLEEGFVKRSLRMAYRPRQACHYKSLYSECPRIGFDSSQAYLDAETRQKSSTTTNNSSRLMLVGFLADFF